MTNRQPTPEEINEAGRKVHHGGLLGRGSTKKADKLVKKAGDRGDQVAWQIMYAAADHEPRT